MMSLRCDNSAPANFAEACDAWLTALKGASSTYTPGAELDVVGSGLVQFVSYAPKCISIAPYNIFDGYNPNGYGDVCATS